MRSMMKILIFITLSPLLAFGQSKEEIAGFIISELKSYELRTHPIKEVAFNASGDTFTFRHAMQGNRERSLVVPLNNVDIYAVKKHHRGGISTFRLLVRCRGLNQNITLNGLAFHGTEVLVPDMENEKQAKALERAFAKLTTLTTGRKFPFWEP